MKTQIHIFVGHYGSGKTECAINYAVEQEKLGRTVAMADMDIVNPYFRTRQQAEVLGAQGIHVGGHSRAQQRAATLLCRQRQR